MVPVPVPSFLIRPFGLLVAVSAVSLLAGCAESDYALTPESEWDEVVRPIDWDTVPLEGPVEDPANGCARLDRGHERGRGALSARKARGGGLHVYSVGPDPWADTNKHVDDVYRRNAERQAEDPCGPDEGPEQEM